MAAQQHRDPLGGRAPAAARRPRERPPGQGRSWARRAATAAARAAAPPRSRAAGASRTSSRSPGRARGRRDPPAPGHRRSAARAPPPSSSASSSRFALPGQVGIEARVLDESGDSVQGRSGPSRAAAGRTARSTRRRAPPARTASAAASSCRPRWGRATRAPRPRRTSRSTWSTAIVPSKRLTRPLARTAAGVIGELGERLLVVARIRSRRWRRAVGPVDRSPDDAVQLPLGDAGPASRAAAGSTPARTARRRCCG